MTKVKPAQDPALGVLLHLAAVKLQELHGNDAPVVFFSDRVCSPKVEKHISRDYYTFIERAYRVVGLEPGAAVGSLEFIPVVVEADQIFRQELETDGVQAGAFETLYVPALGLTYVLLTEAEAWLRVYAAHHIQAVRMRDALKFWEDRK